MVSRDNRGNLMPTKLSGLDQFGWARRGDADTFIELSVAEVDGAGLKFAYPHVCIHIHSNNGKFYLMADEAKQFADELAVYAREAQRVRV